MSSDAKLLKISSLAALFLGLASAILGVVLVVASTVDIDAWMTTFEGVLSTVYGVRTAILANVPSNTPKIRIKAVILAVVAACILGYFVYVLTQVHIAQLCLSGLVAVVAVVAICVSSVIIKKQMQL